MRRKKILPETLTVQEKETIDPKKQGEIEMANWLERQLSQELFEIKQMTIHEILNMPIDAYYIVKSKFLFFNHYLQQVRHIKEQIKND